MIGIKTKMVNIFGRRSGKIENGTPKLILLLEQLYKK